MIFELLKESVGKAYEKPDFWGLLKNKKMPVSFNSSMTEVPIIQKPVH